MSTVKKSPKINSGLRISAAMTISLIALSGCNSSGFTDYAGSLKDQSIAENKTADAGTYSSTYQKEAIEPIAQGQSQVAEAYSETPVEPISPAVEPIDTAAASSSGVVYVPNENATNGGPVQMASLAPASIDERISEQAYAPPLLTPEEIAAQQAQMRIENLSASMKHGKCKSGWGKQAKKLDANRYTPGHPYYIEIRMRHTPPLPVGHTYTAYGRLDENGNKLDESLVMLAPKGGYAGATVASTVPMPSVMTPTVTDCLIKPVAAYRVSLTAHQYENLLKEIKRAKQEQPKYQLFLYNCNHFTSRISESVGIKTPQNKYTSSLVYMYDIIRENEGKDYKFAQR